MKKNLLLIFVLFINIVFTNAKAQNIDSLKIIPSNPTDMDHIEVICYSMYNSSYEFLYSNINNTSPFSIYVEGIYTSGIGLPTTSYSVDTITIGILSAGTYTLTYELIIGSTSDIDSISFTVSGITGITDVNKANNFNIYPNPVTDFLIIENKENAWQKALITDLVGRNVMEFTIKDQKHTQNLDGLPEGTYFVHLISKNNYIESKKVTKLSNN